MMRFRLTNVRLTLRSTVRQYPNRFSYSSGVFQKAIAAAATTTDVCFRNNKPENLPMEVIHHLYWMKQKYDLGQDMYLCGHPGALRRNIVSLFANMYGLEVEYLCITRDTTESDLKQRREIYNSSVVFHDQAPVRAAIHGRLLILDGIEHAERNVLPALNNLLENREMNLDDGRFLMRSSDTDTNANVIVPVHPNFRVIALGCSVPPYNGRSMDPPLRSRFQSRFIDELSSESIMQLLASEISSLQNQIGDSQSNALLSSIFNLYESLRQIRTSQIAERGTATTSLKAMPLFALDSISHCLRVHSSLPHLRLMDTVTRCVPALSFLNYAIPSQLQAAIQLPLNELQKLNVSTISNNQDTSLQIPTNSDLSSSLLQLRSVNGHLKTVRMSSSEKFPDLLLSTQTEVLSTMLLDYYHGRHLCVLGVKVSSYMYVYVYVIVILILV